MRTTSSFADGREASAKRVGSDPSTDVAVIRVQAENLTALTFGDSDGLEVCDFVLAIIYNLQTAPFAPLFVHSVQSAAPTLAVQVVDMRCKVTPISKPPWQYFRGSQVAD